MSKESNLSSIPELIEFEVSHSTLTRQVLVHSSYTDNMAGVPHWPVTEFPDQFVCISRDRAQALISELQKAVAYLDASIDGRPMKRRH
ncbi:hypothetical protein D8682_04860 [Buttiauxella sp. 3AFRM03]|uniref:hypothetical protein n=1 Tax=Buttiauxella sp. 3AFRM03 TaxID=2479367 RepID=UPI000EF75CB2|nr:hypothetical protein [Buttiauxella sp. 3AFRM03]AYN26385.1 hypothetical protein D8682_04860 [Buttiauxella sp. 3AFRM03]